MSKHVAVIFITLLFPLSLFAGPSSFMFIPNFGTMIVTDGSNPTTMTAVLKRVAARVDQKTFEQFLSLVSSGVDAAGQITWQDPAQVKCVKCSSLGDWLDSFGGHPLAELERINFRSAIGWVFAADDERERFQKFLNNRLAREGRRSKTFRLHLADPMPKFGNYCLGLLERVMEPASKNLAE